MKQLRMRARTVLTPVLATGLCLLGACGLDPPPAAGTAAQEAGKPAAVAGLKPTQATGMQLPKENGGTAKCNIETLGGQLLEGEHPTIAASTLVPVAGWYAAPAAEPAATADPAATATVVNTATPTTGEAEPAQSAEAAAAPAAAPGYQLVMASENGAQHWVIALPALGDRPDVAQALATPAALKSGFAMNLDLSELKAGFYSLYVSDSAHSNASVCGLGRGFVIK